MKTTCMEFQTPLSMERGDLNLCNERLHTALHVTRKLIQNGQHAVKSSKIGLTKFGLSK